jgi:hypothetical protein
MQGKGSVCGLCRVTKGINGLEFVRVIHTSPAHCCHDAPMKSKWHIAGFMWFASRRKASALL